MSGQRTLAAIVFTDAVEFSARIGRDEEGTITLIREDLDLMGKMCLQHEGQVMKSTGDGLMMLFTSAVQAVTCSLEIQKALGERVKSTPDTLLLHRIGIHLGDVLLADGDALGEGVNVASRLQEEAEPGGICLSQVVYDVVKNRLFLQAVKVADLKLKNIPEPVRAYKVAGLSPSRRNTGKRFSTWAGMVGAGGLLLVAGVALGVSLFNRPQKPDPEFQMLPMPGFDVADFIPASDPESDTRKAIAQQQAEIEQLKKANEEQKKRNEEKASQPEIIYRYLVDPGTKKTTAKKTETPPKAPIPGNAAKPQAKPSNEDADDPEGGVMVTPMPPNVDVRALTDLPKQMSGHFMEFAKDQYVNEYNFEGMSEWVKDQDNLPPSERAKLVKRYEKLEGLVDWFKVQAKDWKADEPLAMPGGGTAWVDSSGLYHIKHDRIEIVKKLDELTPKEMASMMGAALHRSPMPQSKRFQVVTGLQDFGKEFRLRLSPEVLKKMRTEAGGVRPMPNTGSTTARSGGEDDED